jgi:Lar family restriction alleviation protein
MAQSELKACPFCGSRDVKVVPLDEETFVVDCQGCNATGGYYGGDDSTGPEEAAELWNARAEDKHE